VNDLVARGVAGSVTLNARPGLYTEQIDITPVGGVSQANTVTFQSETSGAALQFAQTNYSASSNWVMRVNSASHIRVKNLSLLSSGAGTLYRSALVLNGSVEDLVVQGDSLSGFAGTSISPGTALLAGSNAWTRNLTLDGNRFGPASCAIYIVGYGNTADSGTVIRANSFTGSYAGVWVKFQPAAIIDSNTVSVADTGLSTYLCPGSLRIQANRVSTSAGGNGILVDSCSGDALDGGRVANNFVSIGGTAGGNGITVQNSSYQNVCFNSVNITAAGTAYGLYQAGGSNVSILDNALSNSAGSYAYCVNTPGAIATSAKRWA
jgi:hypothetical protein